jgi:hypothetical protein
VGRQIHLTFFFIKPLLPLVLVWPCPAEVGHRSRFVSLLPGCQLKAGGLRLKLP